MYLFFPQSCHTRDFWAELRTIYYCIAVVASFLGPFLSIFGRSLHVSYVYEYHIQVVIIYRYL